MAQSDTIFTQILTSSNVPDDGNGNHIFSITAGDGIRGLSIKWVSSTVNFKGSMSLKGLTSVWIPLVDGSPFSFSLALADCQFDIDVTNGSCEIAATK